MAGAGVVGVGVGGTVAVGAGVAGVGVGGTVALGAGVVGAGVGCSVGVEPLQVETSTCAGFSR